MNRCNEPSSITSAGFDAVMPPLTYVTPELEWRDVVRSILHPAEDRQTSAPASPAEDTPPHAPARESSVDVLRDVGNEQLPSRLQQVTTSGVASAHKHDVDRRRCKRARPIDAFEAGRDKRTHGVLYGSDGVESNASKACTRNECTRRRWKVRLGRVVIVRQRCFWSIYRLSRRHVDMASMANWGYVLHSVHMS